MIWLARLPTVYCFKNIEGASSLRTEMYVYVCVARIARAADRSRGNITFQAKGYVACLYYFLLSSMSRRYIRLHSLCMLRGGGGGDRGFFFQRLVFFISPPRSIQIFIIPQAISRKMNIPPPPLQGISK